MDKQDNFQQNFSLKGFTSIQIGLYILIAAFAIKNILEGFLIEGNPLGNLTTQILEFLILIVVFFTIMSSSLALFFKGRRKAKKLEYKLWNPKTKASFWKFITSFSILFLVLICVINQGYLDYVTPVFLSMYAIALLLLKVQKSKNLFILSGICILLALICFLIPSYWYSSLFILGIAHITYGLVVRY